MLEEFKEFAIKGNVVDMAVGIMIGGAFTTVVKSVVDDLLMPPIGLVTGGFDFSNDFVVLAAGTTEPPYTTLAEAKAAGASVLAYGAFINSVIAFVLVALALFFVVRWINRLRRPETEHAPETKACTFCMEPIHKEAKRCPRCTSELGDSAEAA